MMYFLSTMHKAETDDFTTVMRKLPDGFRTTVMRRLPNGFHYEVPCPPLLVDYQQFMRGVDRGDQLIGYYNIGKRSRKWWKQCFSHLIESALLNSYILESEVFPTEHSRVGRNKRDFLSFRMDLAKQLIGGFQSRKCQGSPRSSEHLQLERLNIQLGHWPVKAEKKLVCVVCSTKRTKLHLSRAEMHHETRIKCSFCGVHLCIDGSPMLYEIPY